jgi:hypothetical protein
VNDFYATECLFCDFNACRGSRYSSDLNDFSATLMRVEAFGLDVEFWF